MNEGNDYRFDLWLYNEMQKRGWNNQDMARRSGLNRETIKSFLNNKRNPTMYTFGRIIKALGKHLEIVDN